jgi:hypothetical protein
MMVEMAVSRVAVFIANGCKIMIWGNRHNPLGVVYHIYIMGVLQLVQYTYTYT